MYQISNVLGSIVSNFLLEHVVFLVKNIISWPFTRAQPMPWATHGIHGPGTKAAARRPGPSPCNPPGLGPGLRK